MPFLLPLIEVFPRFGRHNASWRRKTLTTLSDRLLGRDRSLLPWLVVPVDVSDLRRAMVRNILERSPDMA